MKRTLEPQDSWSSSQRPPSFLSNPSQDSAYTVSSEISEQPSYSDRGWKSIFPELIGFDLNDDNNLLLQDDDYAGLEDSIRPADSNGADIESWMTEELSDDFRLQSNDTGHAAHSHDLVHNEDLLCYGMIYRARVKLVGNMTVLKEALNKPATTRNALGSHFLLGIVSENDHLFVQVNSEIHLAQLNRNLDECLKELVEMKAVQLQTIVHAKTLLGDIGSATKETDAHTQVNINVYGPAASSFETGRRLSKYKVWLQRPDWCRPECIYQNPHVIPFAFDDEVQATLLEASTELFGSESLQESLQDVYSNLTRNAHLNGDLVDNSQLKTTLMPHQLKAQQFMIQRVTGPIPIGFELWEPVRKDEQTWYRHKIAGIKSQTEPTETGGGILADEMGMGKTFSMLSLVVNTLRTASEWSMNPESSLADGIPPSQRLSRATLVVVPSPLLLTTWTDEIENQLNVQLKVLSYHGRQRSVEPKDLTDYDVVLTTYHTLIADHHKEVQPVVGVAWYRIILDEAHFIRSPTTYLHKRVAELDAKYRWCLTGTPIQNRLDDVGALFAFLRIFPFDRMNVFRQCISVPFKEGGTRKMAAQENLTKLLDALCIRRTKDLLNLADFEENIHRVYFSSGEWKQYHQTNQAMKRAMHNSVGQSTSSNRFTMFQAQLQLRLLCNHGTHQHQHYFARARNLLDEREDAAVSFAWPHSEGTCSSCQQPILTVDMAVACELQVSCAHVLCQECRDDTDRECPVCKVTGIRLKHDPSRGGSRKSHAREGYFRESGQSSKMHALIEELRRDGIGDKSIVFSHWTTTLDLVEQYLNGHSIHFARIDGNDDISHRKRTLNRFRNDHNLRILIMTTGVGAIGLDLIAANRVHLIEPQWNPSIELQAIGRTLRIGQQKTVRVTRYIVQGSVEQYMQQLQQRKLKMAGMTKSADEAGASKEPKVKDEFHADSDRIFDRQIILMSRNTNT